MRQILIAALGILALALLLPAHADSGSSGSLPPYVLRWPEGIEHVFVADAESSTLTRYGRADGLQSAVYMSIGQRGAGKQREGDRRTPLGVYFVTEQLDTSDLDPMYGVTAFPLDYPNAHDLLLGRDGGGIWVHGTLPGEGRRPVRDTDGCLAIPNQSLLDLSPFFRPQTTPVIIARSLQKSPQPAAATAVAVEAGVRLWLASRLSGDTYALAALYVDDFVRQGLNKSQWVQFWADEPRRNDASVEQLFIAADPEEAGLFVSRFRLTIDGRSTYKRLYWQRQSDGGFRILAEDEW